MVLENRLKQRRILIAAAAALLAHLFFVFVVAPRLDVEDSGHRRTEVVQISTEDLAKLKQRILDNSQKPALFQQELREEFKSKEIPKDARFIAPHNQVVPEETVAGAQRDMPQAGRVGPKNTGDSAEQAPKKLKLSSIGLGGKPLPKPVQAEEISGHRGPQVPRGDDGRPVGREDARLKKGNDNLLNAIESEYYSFFARFEEPIVRNWYFYLRSSEATIRSEIQQRTKSGEGEFPVTVEFVIDRLGNFNRISIVESSNIPTLDSATLQAVRKLGSLQNPPPGLFKDGPHFSYRLQFLVRVSGSPMADSAPDLRWY